MVHPLEERDPLEVLGEEFVERHRRGERPTVAEYATAHPELADGIKRLFPTMVAMERFKVSKLSSSEPSVEMQVEGLQQLGDFRIIREIGRGGMGVVYEAEQQSLARNVAVKVFPRQVITDSRQLRRFRREARTAASLHHTNIVPVFGVGQQDGMHYYVMQRIHGISLEQVIRHVSQLMTASDAPPRKVGKGGQPTVPSILDISSELIYGQRPESATTREARTRKIAELPRNRPTAYWRSVADVGIQVAAALSYAHCHDIFHRDIKPGNLLVDGQGTVWVTDFGLATAGEAERLSNPGDVVGTLRFMAPEILEGDHDARSDIYSLGLTLYELLTLTPAFTEANRAKLVQSILKTSPPRPRAVRPEIPRDLEAVVLKAIARSPRRRYQQADALAEDLRRYLEGRPVRARRVGWGERTWRWTTRNPAIASLTASLLLVLLTSLAMISAKWREAVMENQRAEDNLSLALESMDQILERYGSSWMARPASDDAEAADSGSEFRMAVSNYSAAVLQDALQFYDRFARQNATNPQLLHDTAKVHRRVGDIYERLGQYSQAEHAYHRALDILEVSANRRDMVLAIERSTTMNQLGLVLYATSRFEEAAQQFRNAQTVLASSDMNAPACKFELARSHRNLGEVLWLLRRRDEAQDSHRHAIRLLKELVQTHPREVDYRLALARAYRIYYPLVYFSRRREDAEAIRSAGVAIAEELVRDFPNVPDYQCELSETLATTTPRRRGDSTPQQIAQLERAVEIARQLTQAHHSIPRYQAVFASALRQHASAVSNAQPEAALLRFAEAVEVYRTLATEFADVPVYRLLLAMALDDYADHQRSSGQLAEARVATEEAIVQHGHHLELRPDSRFGKGMLAMQYRQLVDLLDQSGLAAEAEQARARMDDLQRELAIRPR